MAFEILIILVLVLVNGILAGSEIAIVSLRKTRLQELVETGSGSAKAVQYLRQHPEPSRIGVFMLPTSHEPVCGRRRS